MIKAKDAKAVAAAVQQKKKQEELLKKIEEAINISSDSGNFEVTIQANLTLEVRNILEKLGYNVIPLPGIQSPKFKVSWR